MFGLVSYISGFQEGTAFTYKRVGKLITVFNRDCLLCGVKSKILLEKKA